MMASAMSSGPSASAVVLAIQAHASGIFRLHYILTVTEYLVVGMDRLPSIVSVLALHTDIA